jgi:O-antigen/teichoic acid export membrane protein
MTTAVQTTPAKSWNGSHIAVALGISYVGMVATFLSSVALARLLGVEGKGLFSMFQVTVTGIVAFSGLGIGHGQMFHSTREPEKLRHFMANGYVMALLLGGGMAGLYVLSTSLLSVRRWAAFGSPMMAAALIVVPVVSLSVFQQQYFLARHEYRLSKAMVASGQILPLIAYAILFAIKQITLMNVVVAFVATQLLCCVIAEYFVSRTAPPARSFSFSFAKESLTFGIRHYLSGIMEFLMGRLDFFLVAFFLGQSGLGIYSVSVLMAEITTRLPSQLGTVLFPAFASGQVGPGKSAAILRKTLFLAVVLAIVLAILSGPITIMLFGKQYSGAIPAFRCLLVGTVAWSTIYVTWNRTAASGKPGLGMLVFGAAAAFDGVANLFMLPRFGVVGGAIAASGSYLLASFLFVRIFCRTESCSYREALLIRRSDLRDVFQSTTRLWNALRA